MEEPLNDPEDWDEQFWSLFGIDESSSNRYPDDPFDDAPDLQEQYLEMIEDKRLMEFTAHQITINSLQSQILLRTSLTFMSFMSTVLILCWSLWYWFK